jgi:uncharacterized protein YegL
MNVFDQFDLPPEPVEDIEFIAETHRRRLVTLLIDTSASMATTLVDGVSAIDALNRQLEIWLPTVRGEGFGNLRDVEFAVITFGAGGVAVVSGNGVPSAEDGDAFVPAAQLTLAPLRAAGATPMTEAVDLGLNLLEARRHQVQTVHSQQTGKLRMILISDGSPTDFEGNPTDDWRRLAVRLDQWRTSGRVQLFAFGVPGVDDDVMRALATKEGYFRLDELDVAKLLQLILVATTADDSYNEVRACLGAEDEL